MWETGCHCREISDRMSACKCCDVRLKFKSDGFSLTGHATSASTCLRIKCKDGDVICKGSCYMRLRCYERDGTLFYKVRSTLQSWLKSR